MLICGRSKPLRIEPLPWSRSAQSAAAVAVSAARGVISGLALQNLLLLDVDRLKRWDELGRKELQSPPAGGDVLVPGAEEIAPNGRATRSERPARAARTFLPGAARAPPIGSERSRPSG